MPGWHHSDVLLLAPPLALHHRLLILAADPKVITKIYTFILFQQRGVSSADRRNKFSLKLFGTGSPHPQVPPWWIIHASHHTSHAAFYVMSGAWRSDAARVPGRVFLSRLGLRQRWLILCALYFYPTTCPPTHPPPPTSTTTSIQRKPGTLGHATPKCARRL